jgi:serine/threonine protein kinase
MQQIYHDGSCRILTCLHHTSDDGYWRRLAGCVFVQRRAFLSSFPHPPRSHSIVPVLHAVQQEDEGIVLGRKYLLDGGHGEASTSGKSTLVEASSSAKYGSGGDETRATDQKVLVKFSDNIKALQREARIYEKVASQHPDLFVTIHDFYNPTMNNEKQDVASTSTSSTGSRPVSPTAVGSHAVDAATSGTFFDTRTQSLQPLDRAENTNVDDKGKVTFQGQAALVMEMGTQDLKSYIREHGPLKGDMLRDAVVQTARTLKAFHAKKKVWTELKSANFVMIPRPTDPARHALKAIDLESAVPRGQPPIDFSPEAIPPEFAQAYLDMKEHKMEMQKSFDIFSLGLLWYEMATGQQYWQREFFRDQTECDDAEKIGLGMRWRDEICLEHADEMIETPLKGLIARCLRVKPEDRPMIDEVLAHPYIAEML